MISQKCFHFFDEEKKQSKSVIEQKSNHVNRAHSKDESETSANETDSHKKTHKIVFNLTISNYVCKI